MFKKILLIFHKLITFYEHLMTLIHQEYNIFFIKIKFLFIFQLKDFYWQENIYEPNLSQILWNKFIYMRKLTFLDIFFRILRIF